MSLPPDFMQLDPNLIPYQEEWTDNLGGMANAIFWLNENWQSHLNAQGDRYMPNGGRWLWVYSHLTGTLMIYTPENVFYRIDCEKMFVIENGNEEMATIYRPFLDTPLLDQPWNGKIHWRRTRSVEIRQWHYREEAVPFYLHAAVANLGELLKKGSFWGFEALDFTALLPAVNLKPKTTRISPEQALCYGKILLTYPQCTYGTRDYSISRFVTHLQKLLDLLLEFYNLVDDESAEVKLQIFSATLSQMEEDLQQNPDRRFAALLNAVRQGDFLKATHAADSLKKHIE